MTALEAIEYLVSDDLCAEMEMSAAFNENITPELKTLVEKIGAVYRISHSWNKHHPCNGVHENWRKEAEKIVALAAKETSGKVG